MKYLPFLSSLIVNSLEEIYQDLIKNILRKFPIQVILNPDQYNPPFIGAFFSLLQSLVLTTLLKNTINTVCLFLDIIYGFIRLFISIFICGVVSLVHFLIVLWLLGVLLYRWQPVSPSVLLDLSQIL